MQRDNRAARPDLPKGGLPAPGPPSPLPRRGCGSPAARLGLAGLSSALRRSHGARLRHGAPLPGPQHHPYPVSRWEGVPSARRFPAGSRAVPQPPTWACWHCAGTSSDLGKLCQILSYIHVYPHIYVYAYKQYMQRSYPARAYARSKHSPPPKKIKLKSELKKKDGNAGAPAEESVRRYPRPRIAAPPAARVSPARVNPNTTTAGIE